MLAGLVLQPAIAVETRRLCRSVNAAADPIDIVQVATHISATLRVILTAEQMGDRHPFLDKPHSTELMTAARRFLVYLDERAAAGEEVPHQLRTRVERLSLYVPLSDGQSLYRNEFEPLSTDIVEWFRLRRLSRAPNLIQ